MDPVEGAAAAVHGAGGVSGSGPADWTGCEMWWFILAVVVACLLLMLAYRAFGKRPMDRDDAQDERFT